MRIDLFYKKNRFSGPPIDELALHEKALTTLANTQVRSIISLVETINMSSSDLATCILYHHIRQSIHSDFIKKIEQFSTKKINAEKKIKIFIIPGMFYDKHPDIGSNGSLIKSIFEHNGFQVQLVPTLSGGSVFENKKIIRRILLKEAHENVWIISVSKGTADVRACLQDLLEDTPLKNIKGWVNLSGIFSGSILVDHRSDTIPKRLLLRLLCVLTNTNYRFIQELSTSHDCWNKKAISGDQLTIIHALGFPLKSHIQPFLAHRFSILSEKGPNDGVISLLDSLGYPGNVYPIWGCDHFMRCESVSALLYKLCHYIFESAKS